MKNSKSRNDNRKYYDDYDDENIFGKKKEQKQRRPVKNWKKAWVEHEEDYVDRDEFFGK
jgi:hypothetical protein